MTLLVGILCSDGVVVASDRQVTQGSMGMKTIGQPGTKVHILQENPEHPARTLFATSGPIGLGQQYEEIIRGALAEIRSQNYGEVVAKLQQKIRSVILPALSTAQAMAHLVGPQAAIPDAVCGALLATDFKDGQKLVEITPQGGFEYLSEANPFVCIGSGKQNADPLLRFLWSIYWPMTLPDVQEGILAACWTVLTVTDLRSEGVGMGRDVFVIQKEEVKKGRRDWVARQVEEEKMVEHEAFRESITDAIKGVREQLKGTAPQKDVDSPPKLTAQPGEAESA